MHYALCTISLPFGRAKRGGSGALYLQSAAAGLNSRSRLYFCRVCLIQVAMIIGSCATEAREPRQVRKGATVSGSFRVPQVCLIRVNYMGNACRSKSKTGARPINLKNPKMKGAIKCHTLPSTENGGLWFLKTSLNRSML